MITHLLFEGIEEDHKKIKKLNELIMDEYEAINGYADDFEKFTDDEKKVVAEIIQDERIHIKQLEMLLRKYQPDYKSILNKAEEENKELLSKKEIMG